MRHLNPKRGIPGTSATFGGIRLPPSAVPFPVHEGRKEAVKGGLRLMEPGISGFRGERFKDSGFKGLGFSVMRVYGRYFGIHALWFTGVLDREGPLSYS